MERLVYLGDAAAARDVLDRAAWRGVDGVELDLTAVDDDGFDRIRDAVRDAAVTVRSVHDGRTRTVGLQEWALFRSHLDRVAERARELGASSLSVHPPHVEVGSAHTVRDVQEFMGDVDADAAGHDLEVWFALDGFLLDPELVRLAFDRLDDPAIGVMVDLGARVDGVDPVPLLEKLDARLRKVRAAGTVDEMEQELAPVDGEIVAVAEHIDGPG